MAYTNCELVLSVKEAADHEKWLKTRDLGIGVGDKLTVLDRKEEQLYNQRQEVGRIADRKKKSPPGLTAAGL